MTNIRENLSQAELKVLFLTRLQKFLQVADDLRAKNRAENFSNLPPTKPMQINEGKRYVKVVEDDGDGHRSVYCFVDSTNGDVLKAASWKAPAKHARSNIWDDDYGLSGLTAYGAKYL